MIQAPGFVRAFAQQGASLLKAGAVKEPLFSRGTYQIEVQKKYFPYIQMNDEGQVTDFFCTCEESEKGNGCPHLAASYLRIFNGKKEPLHVRFRKSLWNRLFQLASKRHGDDPKCMKKAQGGYVCLSNTKKKLFFIKAKLASAKKRLDQIIGERVKETEETSLKFSNLSAEEIASYKEGRAGHSLSYELSFWSDLAKWLMCLEDEGQAYTIEIGEEEPLSSIQVEFSSLLVWSYIPEVNWPWIIPTLATVHSPLPVFDTGEETIEEVSYDEKTRSILVKHKSLETKASPARPHGTPLGEWIYVPHKGFYRQHTDPLLEQESIPEAQISQALSQLTKELERYLPLHVEPRKCQYHLFFDSSGQLHIELYVLEMGDMHKEEAACFVPWAYVPGKGFYLLEDWLFEGKEKVLLKQEVAEFINRHRIWLHQFPGFQTHLGSLESRLVYHLDEEENLIFNAELNFPEGYGEILNLDEWVYIKGEGFYMKKESRGRLPIHPGLSIPKEEISHFIAGHKEELEQVEGFFSTLPLLEKTGLEISLNDEGTIVVEPRREYVSSVDPSKVKIFGHYLFIEEKGFSEIPPLSRLPDRYQERVEIPKAQEGAFLAYELDPLKAYALTIDPRLQKPIHLRLKLRRVWKDKKRKVQDFLVDVLYESEIGSIDVFRLWEAMQDKKTHLFSPAGLLNLKDLRFHWIKQLPKRRLDSKRGVVRLTTLEWIRLTIFEEIEPPKGEDEESVSARSLLRELEHLETHRLLDISQLKATLRPYQEQGLHWLWFLYCHGLSGLLCDDMGLGKTHQTMALLASIAHEDPMRRNKYLVVCPTSVLYHWQELLKRFMPEMRVCVYHGLDRNQQDLEQFEERFDLLVTSYGILRTGREDFRSIFFEVAIFDEVQIAKNHVSQTHQALRALRANMRLGLSGTPIENRIRELKALFDLVLPGYMPQDAVFRDLFVIPIEKGEDPEKKTLLGRLVKPFILRRKKSEVLRDLPEKIEEISYCDLSEEQKELYRSVALGARPTYDELKDETKPAPYIHVFSLLSKLKQVCNHPSLFLEDIKNAPHHVSGKFELFTELLNEARGSGQKVVIFSQFLGMIAIIEQYLRKKGIGYASIKGATRDRSEQIRRFREDPQCEVFVASLLAAGVGIDLTVASIVIHYDRWWNPAKENQATDRVHRIGQNRGVQVFKLVVKDTIEEHIHQMIEKKKGLLEGIIGTEDQINYLNREELLEVFEKIFKEVE